MVRRHEKLLALSTYLEIIKIQTLPITLLLKKLKAEIHTQESRM